MIKKVILSLLICLFIFIFLEVGLHFSGYLYNFKHRDKLKKQLIYSQDKDVVIVCVGDSNTYGSEAEYGYDYPHQLEELLNNSELPYRFIVYNLGIIGQNSSQLKQRLYKNIEKYKPDFIVVLIGVNNRWNLMDSDYYLTPNLQISSWSKIKTFINNLHTVKLVRISISNLKNKFFLLKIFHNVDQTVSLKNTSNNSNYSIDGNLTLVESYINQRRYIEALEKIKEIENVPYGDERLYLALGRIYFWQNRYNESINAYNRALLINPKNIAVLHGKALSYREQGQYEKALSIYRDMLQIDPNDVKIKIDFRHTLLNFQHKWAFSPKEYKILDNWLKRDLEDIVQIALRNNATPILLTYPTQNWQDEIRKSVADKFKIPFIDIYARLHRFVNIGDYLGETGGHPNAKGYYVMAKEVSYIIEEQLKKCPITNKIQ